MTVDKLRKILSSEQSLSLQNVKDLIYELKNDCIGCGDKPYEMGYYNGEVNAFYICLDLLSKVTDVKSKRIYYSPACLHCDRDEVICKEEGKCMKEYSING